MTHIRLLKLRRLTCFRATVHVAHAHKHRGNRWADSKEAVESNDILENMTECAQMIEKYYFKGPYVFSVKIIPFVPIFSSNFSLALPRWCRNQQFSKPLRAQ